MHGSASIRNETLTPADWPPLPRVESSCRAIWMIAMPSLAPAALVAYSTSVYILSFQNAMAPFLVLTGTVTVPRPDAVSPPQLRLNNPLLDEHTRCGRTECLGGSSPWWSRVPSPTMGSSSLGVTRACQGCEGSNGASRKEHREIRSTAGMVPYHASAARGVIPRCHLPTQESSKEKAPMQPDVRMLGHAAAMSPDPVHYDHCTAWARGLACQDRSPATGEAALVSRLGE